jgi:toxin secretion/phage lysis holin
MKSIFNFITGTVLTGVLYLLGGWDIALQTLIIVISIDYVSGICKAIYSKKLNSKVGIKGILKKFSYLLTVALAVEIDKITGGTGAIRTLVIYFFVANDGISILENLGGMGIPLPAKLKEVLEQLRDDNNPKNG